MHYMRSSYMYAYVDLVLDLATTLYLVVGFEGAGTVVLVLDLVFE